MEYYLTIKKHKILSFAKTLMLSDTIFFLYYTRKLIFEESRFKSRFKNIVIFNK